MELTNPKYHEEKAREMEARLPEGNPPTDSAASAKARSQEQMGDGASAKASSREQNTKISTQVPFHESHNFKNFINLIHNHLSNEAEDKSFNLNTLDILLQGTEALAKENNFNVLHTQLRNHAEDLKKTQEGDESIDLNLMNRNESVQDLILNLLEKVFETSPHLKLSAEELAANANNKEVEEKSVEKEEKPTEYKNKLFGGIFEAIKNNPIGKFFLNQIVGISVAGSISHGADAFAKISQHTDKLPTVPDNIEKAVGWQSMWWSKIINPMGNILRGFEALGKNNIVEGLFRGSLLGKLFVDEASNLGVPVGLFLDHKMTIMSAENTGFVKKVKKDFGSFGESVSYHVDLYKNILKNYWNNIKKGDKPIENAALLYAVPMLGISSLVGMFTMKGQVNGPWAQALGAARNTSGGIWDVVFTKQRINRINEIVKESTGRAANMSDYLKDNQVQFMALYFMNSVLDLTMRCWKNPITTIIQAQISNSIYEMANGLSGVESAPNDLVAFHENKIKERNKDKDGGNAIKPFQRIKELGSALAESFNRETAAAFA